MKHRARVLLVMTIATMLLAATMAPVNAGHSATIDEFDMGAGSLPQGVAAGYGAVWVTDADPNNNVLRIDPTSGAVTDVIPLPAARLANAIAIGAASGPLRGVWVAPEGDGGAPQEVMFRIDPDTLTIDAFDLPEANEPSRIAVGFGHVWYTVVATDTVGKLDPATGVVTELVLPSSGVRPIGITTGRGHVWVAEQDGDAIARVNPRSGAIVELPLGSGVGAFGLTVASGGVWFTGGFSGAYVGRLDIRTGAVTMTSTTAGGFPVEIVRSRNSIWYTDLAASEVGSIALADGTLHVNPTTTLGSGPFGLAREGTTLWFAESVAEQVGRLTP